MGMMRAERGVSQRGSTPVGAVRQTAPVPLGQPGPLKVLERATGVEPASSAWKAEVLPMNYARTAYGRGDRT